MATGLSARRQHFRLAPIPCGLRPGNLNSEGTGDRRATRISIWPSRIKARTIFRFCWAMATERLHRVRQSPQETRRCPLWQRTSGTRWSAARLTSLWQTRVITPFLFSRVTATERSLPQGCFNCRAASNPRHWQRQFQQDGHIDLAVADEGNNTVSIFLGNGDGTFQNRTDYAVGTSPVWISAADFNADGVLDLAVADSGASTATNNGNSVSILLGQVGANGSANTELSRRARKEISPQGTNQFQSLWEITMRTERPISRYPRGQTTPFQFCWEAAADCSAEL